MVWTGGDWKNLKLYLTTISLCYNCIKRLYYAGGCMRLSIRTKLFIMIFSILLLFSMSLLMVMQLSLEKMFTQKYEEDLVEFYDDFDLGFKTSKDFDVYLRAKEKKLKGPVTITNSEFKIIATTSPELRFREHIPYNDQKNALKLTESKESFIVIKYYDEKLNSNQLYIIGILSTGDYLMASKSLDTVIDAASITMRIVMITLLLMLVIGSIIAYSAAVIITKPIFEINKVVHKIANLDFDDEIMIKNNDELGDLGQTINGISDEIETILEDLKELSTTDALTQLGNRIEIDRVLEKEKCNLIENDQMFSLILIDIDHFKNVNDTYGHSVGDQVLIELSGILKKESRGTDVIGRWGGEEFIIVLPNMSEEDAYAKAEKLRVTVSEHIFDIVGQVTISMGVGEVDKDDDLKDFFVEIDKALYKAKENGRNRVELKIV